MILLLSAFASSGACTGCTCKTANTPTCCHHHHCCHCCPQPPKEDFVDYIATMLPFTPGLDNHLKVVHRLVQGYAIGDGTSFPNSSNMGLSKD